MTKFYVVLTEDRHIDVQVDLFSEKDVAIDFARSEAKEYCKYPEDYQEEQEERYPGWLFYAQYSCEGSIRVIPVELDKRKEKDD